MKVFETLSVSGLFHSRRFWLLAAIAIGFVTGTLALLQSTSNGMGFSPDSVSYLAVAEGIRSGDGFVDARRYNSPAGANYPPGYSILLAASSLINQDLMQAGRVLHAFLLGLNTALLGLLAFLAFRSVPVVAFVCLASLGLADTYIVYRMIWSEAPFVTSILIFLISFGRYQQNGSLTALIVAGMAASTAAIIRMPGVAVIGAGAFVLLVAPGTWQTKLRRSFVFGILCGLPFFGWLARNLIVTGQVYLDRPASLMAFTSSNLTRAGEVLSGWTGEPAGIAVLFAAILLLGLPPRCTKTNRSGQFGNRLHVDWRVIGTCALFAAMYFLVTLFAVFAYGMAKPMDARYFLPVYGPLAVCAMAVLHAVLSRLLGRAAHGSPNYLGARRTVGSVIVAAALLGFGVFSVQQMAESSRPYDRGILKRPVPEIMTAYANIQTNLPILSNYDDRVYMFVRRPVDRLPRLYRVDRNEQRASNYGELVRKLRARLQRGGYVVYLLPHKRLYLPSPEELGKILHLKVHAQSADGIIFFATPTPAD